MTPLETTMLAIAAIGLLGARVRVFLRLLARPLPRPPLPTWRQDLAQAESRVRGAVTKVVDRKVIPLSNDDHQRISNLRLKAMIAIENLRRRLERIENPQIPEEPR